MSEQQLLFGLQSPTWVDRMWERIEPERRRKVVLILAKAGREAIVRKPAAQADKKERGNES